MKPLKKFNLSNIVAIFAVMLVLATAIALFAGNAHAAEENNKASNDATYDLTCTVLEEEDRISVPLPNVLVKFFNNDGTYVGEEKTDVDGKCYFNNLSEINAAGTLLFAESGYPNLRQGITLADYDADHKVERQLTYDADIPANFFINSNDTNHMSFNFTENNVDGETVRSSDKFNNPSFTDMRIFLNCVATYQVKNDGTLNVTPHNLTTGDADILIVDPLAKEGFELDYWTLQYKDGDPIILKAGEKHDIYDESYVDFDVHIQAFYKAVEVPPAPTPEVVTETAQTGDNSMPAVVALGILAAAASVVLISNRRSRGINL